MTALSHGAVRVLLCLVLLAGAWWHGHRTGAAGVQVEWDADQARMTARLLAQEQAARAAEQQHAQALATIDAQYQEKEHHAQLENNRLRAQLRAGTVRLSVPVVAGSCNLPADDSSSGSRDAAPRAELSAEAADDLVALADDADAIVRQLTACQAVVGEYQR
ncbi:lysis system i-spanin subunit Rz [Laribacter hongkongensis]|uniref:lysis system i-spanin subunit Rz n=1 Tax=Laribacter hongkongensis TaxID=168471 RepID=UPI001EFD99B6|nr:lysis system i-spanin subunit Rz [Laribacter hongkongensis]MCG9076813.1 lysis protein [Laribacter hongkongensis]